MQKRPIVSRSCLTAMAAFVLVLLCCLPAAAQDFPYAAKKDYPLSFRNKKEFDQYVETYKTSMCVNAPSGCTIQTEVATRARDALLFGTLAQIDLNFTKFQRRSRHAKVIFETLMDFLKLGADAAAIITNGERGKNIITAGSSLVSLLKSSTEKNLQLAELNILFNKMEANRSKQLASILPKVVGGGRLDAKDYPFEIAWLDIVQYYRAGTLDTALADLAGDTGQEKADAEATTKALMTNLTLKTH
jgi:hypothetical protein